MTRGKVIALAALALALVAAHSYAAEKIILNVFVNTVEKGEQYIIRSGEGATLIPLDAVAEFGLKDPPASAVVSGEDGKLVNLNAFPGVVFEIDEKQAALRITAQPELFRDNIVDLGYKSPGKVQHAKDDAAFFNYSINYNAGDKFDFTSMSAPLEAGVSFKGFFAFTSYNYTKTDVEEKTVRLLSNITKDDTDALRRYVAGDFAASSGGLGGGGTYGGVGLAKNYSISPNFIKTPALDISGFLKTPSDVELLINGLPVHRESLPPGRFELRNLPASAGSGEAVIVIRDAFGREERIVRPFFLSSALLKPGLHEYSYNAGFKREGFSKEDFRYSELTLLGSHRYGFTDWLTAGARAEMGKKTANAGPQVNVKLWKFGDIDASFAMSSGEGRAGAGGAFGYSFGGKGVSLRASVKGLSRGYSNLNTAPDADKTRLEKALGIGYSMQGLGSISAAYSVNDMYQGVDVRRKSLFYSRRLLKDMSLIARASRTRTDVTDNEIFVSVMYFLDKDVSGSIDHSVNGSRADEKGTLQKNAPLGSGWGGRLSAENAEKAGGHKEAGADAFAQYKNSYGSYSADYRNTAQQNSYLFNAAGAVSYINGSVHLSRPITDSVAVVKTGNLENVTVNYNNEPVGKTDKNGEIVLPEMMSYYENDILIEDRDIPVNYAISEVRKYVAPSYRGGAVVRFDLTKLQAFGGKFVIVEKGAKTPAEFFGIGIQLADRQMEEVVGKGGEFYFENLPPGKHPARLFFKDKECKFDFVIPESDETTVDMGTVSCEIH